MAYYKSISKQIDVTATAALASKLLKDYPAQRAIAHRGQALRSPLFDGMPQGSSDGHGNERAIVNSLDAADFVATVDAALETVKALHGVDQYNLLQWCYIKPWGTQQDIADRIALSNAAYYRRKQLALVSFAQAFPPTWGELLVYKGGEPIAATD